MNVSNYLHGSRVSTKHSPLFFKYFLDIFYCLPKPNEDDAYNTFSIENITNQIFIFIASTWFCLSSLLLNLRGVILKNFPLELSHFETINSRSRSKRKNTTYLIFKNTFKYSDNFCH